MPLPELAANAAAQCAVIAARLRAQRVVAALALGSDGVVALTLLASLDGRAASLPPWLFAAAAVAAAVLAAAERYLALRIDLDARLFAWLERSAATDGGVELGLAALDAALLSLRLLPNAKAGRSLAMRRHGAWRLLCWHGSVAALQLALAVALLAFAVVAFA